jgi:serine/threonine protein kinase
VKAAVSAISDDFEDLTSALNALYDDIINAVNTNQIPGVSDVSDSPSIEEMLFALVDMIEISNPPEVDINSSSHDMAFVNISFATIQWKQGRASNVRAQFRHANSSVYVDCVLKLGQSSMHESIRKEYAVMLELNIADPDHFIKPFALLYGNNIQSDKSASDNSNPYANCIAIAMECGTCNLREYIGVDNRLGLPELSAISRHMLDAVCTATKKGFVLLDIKLENFVRVTGTPDRYKAIDFDSAVKIGEDFSSAEVAVTYGYVSPEIAKLYLARASRSSVKIVTRADASSTVFSLGLILFELFNNLTPFWKNCGLRQESEFLAFAANELTNDIVNTNIDRTFGHANYYMLTPVLKNALECNPSKRISAQDLRKRSLFGDNVSINVRDIHVNVGVINRRITNVDENLADLTAAVRVEMAAH